MDARMNKSAADSPISLPALFEGCMGDHSIVLLLLDKFEAQLNRDVPELVRFAEAGDTAGVTHLTHALKGAAGMMAASRLHQAAAEIESSARSNDLVTIMAELGGLRAEVDRCLQQLPAVRNQAVNFSAQANSDGARS